MPRNSAARSTMPDLFGPPAQPDLFGEVAQPQADYAPRPEYIRAKLLRLLDKARAADVSPWNEMRTRYWKTVFPQMADWLPEEEARQLRLDFAAELDRLTGGQD